MSAQFRLAKKKYTQHELRKLMNEQKSTKNLETKKIESPLAKYNESGQLTCVLCKTIVRSEAVWIVHVNAKQHKENVALAKQLKERTQNFTVLAVKRQADTPVFIENSTNKKIKSILKNSTSSQQNKSNGNGRPNDFFDTDTNEQSNNINRKEFVHKNTDQKDSTHEKMEIDDTELTPDDKLPEGFFDDPVKDAKARNQEYRDPNDEEWDRFQKAIKEETNVSIAIINEEQEESTAERQISEIDEQMRNWSR